VRRSAESLGQRLQLVVVDAALAAQHVIGVLRADFEVLQSLLALFFRAFFCPLLFLIAQCPSVPVDRRRSAYTFSPLNNLLPGSQGKKMTTRNSTRSPFAG
jgi:hypothetical protein